LAGHLLIYGATGYTGRLLAKRASELGMNAILAARGEKPLRAVAQGTNLPCRHVRLDDLVALHAVLRDAVVVLNAAGPFAATARPLVEACLSTGTHYLDVSGELPAIQALHRYDSAAHASGIMIMPAVGFVVVATDCLAAHVASRMPDARQLRLALSRAEFASRGSYSTMLGLVRAGVSIRRDGRLCAVPVGRLERGFDYGVGKRISTAVSWADVFTAYHTTQIPNVEVYMEADAWRRYLYQAAAYFAAPLGLGPVQALLKLQVRVLPEGPSEGQRAAAPRVIVAEAEDRYRRRVQARLYTPDGYDFTALSALAIAERVMAGDIAIGFQTPGGLYGADFVLRFQGVRREDVNGA
jgi:short subunit dehydrogenase-like uncharacterized protein